MLSGLKHLFFKLDHAPEFCAQFSQVQRDTVLVTTSCHMLSVQVMCDKYEHTLTAIDFIREIADVDPSDASRDSTAKNIQSFIESVSQRLPRVVSL